MTTTHLGRFFLPSLSTVERPPWDRARPDDEPLPPLITPLPHDDEALDGLTDATRELLAVAREGIDAIADVFGRCEWCRRPTPGVLADCTDPDCPGGAR